MPKEKASYRDNLERILEAFPDKEMLTRKDAAAFLGRDVRTIDKHLVFTKMGISKASLARQISS